MKVLLRSKDVLHNFTVTQFRVKMDLVPGMITHLWLTPTVPGSYEILCEELCGVGHFAMRGRVVVTTRDEFDTWLAAHADLQRRRRRSPRRTRPRAPAQYAVCTACHGAVGRGQSGAQRAAARGPGGLVPARASCTHFRDGLRGAHERDTYGAQMRAFASMLPDDAAIRNIAAYIESLPGQRAAGDASTATSTAAGACTRPAPPATAPRARASGRSTRRGSRDMSDWYLVRQLRTSSMASAAPHRQDYYGWQMATMADSLKDERSINDVVAYINTLEPSRRAPR